MFSGIVETIGNIISLQLQSGCKHFTIKPVASFHDICIGESIAVNGVCLTVTAFTEDSFNVTAVPETLRLTNLDALVIGDAVNLERAMQANSRIGGHYMQGHIDNQGEILSIEYDASNAWLVKIRIPESLTKYVVAKGFISINGMSITIIDVTPTWFTVTFIPHTQQVTTTRYLTVGSKVNIEVDMMAKYIEKLVGAHMHARTN